MNRKILVFLIVLSGASVPIIAPAAFNAEASEHTSAWNFTVYLDDAEIGYHNFLLTDEGGRQRLTTEADFKVKFLFITAYRYEHVNQETWHNDCLEEIDSTTDANGKKFSVHGYQADRTFAVEATSGRSELAGCVKTFAYWNPDILDEPALLNSQTGEILPITVEELADEVLLIRGEATPARRYRLLAKNMELDIWYSNDNRWLALQSTVKGGRKLRYELT